ncbi:tail assembly chaperone [Limosilactobacillus reuteri]|uniref:tail assembly chaperone n=1 Tax=Limosilactobacillus reuteri TaxID=1598 RepID=UPI0021A6F774|nr:tail assembly chaperone [Limosilactobacillus reuteri]MCT3189780.1 hypothetical protein [Limosilactobacillus reuteri]MCT3198081.1 hypothetical protein [Limosilactobacillus reuteri]
MKLKINGEDKLFIFGVKFIRNLDKNRGVEGEQNGMKMNFGMGLTVLMPSLVTQDASALADALFAAAKGNVTQDEIDNYIDNSKNLEGLFKQVINEIKESNAAKPVVKNLKA